MAVRRRRLLVFMLLVALGLGLVAALASPSSVPTYGARVLHLSIDSRFVHGRMPVTLVEPSGANQGRPLLVFLHGRGEDQNSEISAQLFSALRALGGRAPDIAFPYGGDHSYWHNRAGGDWGSYVLGEVIPKALATLHADPRRVAIGGISMGGFGAYDLARQNPTRFCAVGGHSAAIWPAAGLTAPGAFDDRADFLRHDVMAWPATHPDPFGRARLWLDGGDQDPFHQADELLAHELGIRMHIWPGGHGLDYWDAHWHDYLNFYASALANCR
jgi:S-formylglutathione hydrolase FrmB